MSQKLVRVYVVAVYFSSLINFVVSVLSNCCAMYNVQLYLLDQFIAVCKVFLVHYVECFYCTGVNI